MSDTDHDLHSGHYINTKKGVRDPRVKSQERILASTSMQGEEEASVAMAYELLETGRDCNHSCKTEGEHKKVGTGEVL
jgi:hypothetical protein